MKHSESVQFPKCTALSAWLSLAGCWLLAQGCFAEFPDRPEVPDSAWPDAGPDPDGSFVCGNGLIDPGEECDSTNLGGTGCEEYGFQVGVPTCG